MSSCCMLKKDQDKQVGHEDGDIHFGLVDKACKRNEDMDMPCRVLDNMGCEGKPMKMRNRMVDEET